MPFTHSCPMFPFPTPGKHHFCDVFLSFLLFRLLLEVQCLNLDSFVSKIKTPIILEVDTRIKMNQNILSELVADNLLSQYNYFLCYYCSLRIIKKLKNPLINPTSLRINSLEWTHLSLCVLRGIKQRSRSPRNSVLFVFLQLSK